ncbi:CYTH domain-containing protein [Marinobacter gelidimuriae]|uniref:CYTH domain-containing protein n=1 Tax=Marinobacter gelidimuriae TaxID=2739064 RepID=UPI00037D9B90|nr:CYTH domain-containing protein [Marinobacter gelidimuriae]
MAEELEIKLTDTAWLGPVFETNFERRVFVLNDGQAVIECALDRGSIIAREHRQPLNEVEFELKSGDPSRLTVWATTLLPLPGYAKVLRLLSEFRRKASN